MRFSSVLLAGVAACTVAAGRAVPPVRRVEVSVRVHYGERAKLHRTLRDPASRTVLWLAPLDLSGTQAAAPGVFTMVQKEKRFHPGLLVIPLGSTVSFPNADAFFHNVFSLFNGRRFDLGLYESGQSRNVVFNREGVSYIFCNIHPEMSAVIISLKTPYYALPDADGMAVFRAVPEGAYRLQVWSEVASAEVLHAAGRMVTIDHDHPDLGSIELPASLSVLDDHLDKFGQPYETHGPAVY